MTDEEIDAMEAGQELDLLVAKLVMGWRNLEYRPGRNDGRSFSPQGHYGEGPDGSCYLTHGYSTNIASAWLVVEKIDGLNFVLSVELATIRKGRRGCHVIIGRRIPNRAPLCEHITVQAETFPLAICRAALKCCKDVAGKNEGAKKAPVNS